MNASHHIPQRDRIIGGLWGALVGDALGVPVEFNNRAVVQANPVTDMCGYGTYKQPPGTWSDDGALILCTVDSLLHKEFDTQDMGQRFVRWLDQGLWTAWGNVFDVGMTTSVALGRIAGGTPAEQAGGQEESSNGNGSLMRILPVALRFADEPQQRLVERLCRASNITHAHPRSQMACAFHGLFVRQILKGEAPIPALDTARQVFEDHYRRSPEMDRFRNLFDANLGAKPQAEISSSGYVLDTLMASLWCLLTTNSYEECVLRAVNLGGDSDTTGCVAGGLAGVYYGVDAVPLHWREALSKKVNVSGLFTRFAQLLESRE